MQPLAVVGRLGGLLQSSEPEVCTLAVLLGLHLEEEIDVGRRVLAIEHQGRPGWRLRSAPSADHGCGSSPMTSNP